MGRSISTRFTIDDTITPIPFGVEVTMYLEDGEVSGNSGCNTFVRTYELDGTGQSRPKKSPKSLRRSRRRARSSTPGSAVIADGRPLEPPDAGVSRSGWPSYLQPVGSYPTEVA